MVHAPLSYSFCKIPLGKTLTLLLMGIQNYDVFVCFFRHLDIEPVGGLGLFSLVGTDYRIEKLVTLLPAYSTVSELVQRIVAVNARDIVLIVENQVPSRELPLQSSRVHARPMLAHVPPGFRLQESSTMTSPQRMLLRPVLMRRLSKILM